MQVMEPIEALKKILAERGIGALEQPDLVEALMQDHCPNRKPDINLLVSSLNQGVPQRLMSARNATHRGAVIGQVCEQLQRDLGMQPEKALWAVNTWLKALLPGPPEEKKEEKVVPPLNGTPALTARQIKTDRIILRVFGFVIVPAMLLFLLAQVPDLIRHISADGMAALWPPSRSVTIGLILAVGAFLAAAFKKN